MTTKRKRKPAEDTAGVTFDGLDAFGDAPAPLAKPATTKARRPRAKAPTGDTLADRVRAEASKRPPRRQRTTPEYGRAAEGYPQLNVRVTPEAKRRLERYCFEHGVLKADVVDVLILDNLPDA